jgi:Tfp pilus assembly ATPase PilU
MIELQKLLETVIEKKASDLHITTGPRLSSVLMESW